MRAVFLILLLLDAPPQDSTILKDCFLNYKLTCASCVKTSSINWPKYWATLVSASLIEDFMDFSICSSSVCMHLKRKRKERSEGKKMQQTTIGLSSWLSWGLWGYNQNSAVQKDTGFVPLATYQTLVKALSTHSKYTKGQQWTLMNNLGITMYFTDHRPIFAAVAVSLYQCNSAIFPLMLIVTVTLGCLHFNCSCVYPSIFHDQRSAFNNFHFLMIAG